MPRGTCRIFNWDGTGNTYDVKQTWGVSLSDGSLSALIAPPAAKERIRNESRLENGERIDIYTPTRFQAREVTLEMHLIADSFDELVSNFNSFISALTSSPQGFRLSFQIYGRTMTYDFQYISCTQFAQYNGTLAKYALRLSEQQPNNGAVTLNLLNNDEDTE